jgi:hypothetical protein
MNKAGSDASSAFRLWVEYAVGDDVDARKKVIEDLIKRKSGRKQQFEDYAQALAHKDEKLFVLVEEAIKWKVFLKHHDNKMEHLADTVARKTSDLRSASKGFVPISDLEPWLGEIPSLVGDIVDFNYMIRIYSAIESGISIRMRFGISEDSFGRATLSDVMDNYKRDDIIFGLIQLELAEAKSLQVDVEMERARISSIEDSMQRLSAAINTAEELNKAVRTELVMLHSGSWSGNASEIPRLTQTLKQRTRFSAALSDDVPEDIVNLKKEAKTEIAQSWAYLERIIERANK